MEELIRSQNDYRYAQLPDAERGRLLDELAHAAVRARIGFEGVFAGSQAKPAVRTIDNLAFDVCYALWDAGIPVTANRDAAASLAQSLARAIAHTLGLVGEDGTLSSLYPSMQRAKRYLCARDRSGDGVAQAWLEGRLVVEFVGGVADASIASPIRCNRWWLVAGGAQPSGYTSLTS
jgi:hypothetical protein